MKEKFISENIDAKITITVVVKNLIDTACLRNNNLTLKQAAADAISDNGLMGIIEEGSIEVIGAEFIEH